MRGANAFNKIFNELPGEKHRKGRSCVLNGRRNELLLERFCYYGEFSKRRYDLIIKILSAEFFLSPVTIPEIICDNMEMVKKIKAEMKDLTERQAMLKLKNKWPQMEWKEILSPEVLNKIELIN